VATANPNLGFLDRHHFVLRRLHSLSGIVPVGAFLVNHLLANSTAFLGAKNFDHHIGIIHDLPWLPWIEFLFIILPLAFHAIYGLAIALEGRPNASQYPYMDNWRYTLQRVTAYIALAFIALHLAHFRFAYLFGGKAYGDAFPQFFTFTREAFNNMWMPLGAWIAIYAIGTAATIYHFCNGIVTFCITWGITVGDASRKKVSYGALALGLLLAAWGTTSLIAFSRVATGEIGPHNAETAQVIPQR
jgi:succinate dehydrogenase / fumarate reductase cytochrome b subunit